MYYIFDFLYGLIDPIFIAFLIISLGLFIGGFSFKGVSFSLSAVLILSILSGALVSSFEVTFDAVIFNNNFLSVAGNFSTLGTALFVTSVGFSAGYSFLEQKMFNYKPFLISMVVVGVDFLALLIALNFNLDVFEFELLCGIFCGAMTSTPGLAALCEKGNVNAASSGYACSYLIGVLSVVIFTQIVMKSKRFSFFMSKEKKIQSRQICCENRKSILLISVSIILGYIVGNIKILGFSFGTSAGLLIAGIIVSFLSKKAIPSSVLGFTRELGLVMFFVGTGVVSGIKSIGNFNFAFVLYGALFTVIPIAFGFFISMILYKRNVYQALCVVCGVMTSTPAITLLLKENDQADICDYSISYTGALLTMVFAIRMVCYFY